MTIYGLYPPPHPAAKHTSNDLPSEIARETSYDITELSTYVQINEVLLLTDQKHAYDTIVQQVQGLKGGVSFLNAPGRTGKTFVTRLVLAKVRLQKVHRNSCDNFRHSCYSALWRHYTLQVGIPVILIRNLNPPTLCNGTRLVITKLLPNVIEATIMTICGKGQDVFIPQIPLVSSAAELPFTFCRVQFPIRLSYAMSINKSQRQSLSVVGLYLAEPCFSHNQLYVGCSRVGCRNSLHAFITQGITKKCCL
uniref:DNA helicase Pif1-like 2B domain-containing protein n=1 Tax=Octopus bimaculoides TaxID=37653 RepID=A0A0L8HH53_OCTBM